ncbi:unnamed protein product [Rhizophagus irregularis]|nr:unnamed protein product [Rhizophagus irregularis]
MESTICLLLVSNQNRSLSLRFKIGSTLYVIRDWIRYLFEFSVKFNRFDTQITLWISVIRNPDIRRILNSKSITTTFTTLRK